MTPAQSELLLDLYDHCVTLQLAKGRMVQARGREGFNDFKKQFEEDKTYFDMLIQECAITGVPADRVSFVLDNYT